MRRASGILATLFLPLAAACSRAPAVTVFDLGCPSVAELRDYRPPEASRVFAADGSVIADLSPQRRTVVSISEIPPLVRDGFVAVEDRRFWSHSGVDLRGVARAAWRDLTSLSFREGFSTITMQLVRNVFPEELPRGEKIRRKLCEVWLAPRIESMLSKQQILELYLNQVYMGSGLYGVEAAARSYFGKPVAQVDAAEAALLIGLIQSPEGYNPRRNPERAVARRNVVLDVMAREGVIPEAEADAAKGRPLAVRPPQEAAGPAPHFIAAVRAELRERFGADADVRGYNVYTGLDPVAQRAAMKALEEQLERIEGGAYGTYRHPTPGSPEAAAMDSTSSGSPYLEGMVVALDPRTGTVRALVGGRDFGRSQFDRALAARRQPGSAFKPIVYAAALSHGLPVTTRIETSPVVLAADGGSPPWQPGDHAANIGAISMREALAVSSNSAAVRVGSWVGEARVASMARALGLSTPIPEYPSIHLGSAEVVPIELVAAYAAFANGGYRVRPTLITRVEDRHGSVLWRAPVPVERVLDEGVAFLTVNMLQDVVDRGTGTAVRSAGFHYTAAGKTGTTNDSKDAWFIGMTSDLVAGIWIGFDRPQTIFAGAGGGTVAAPVWGAMMAEVYRDRPAPAGWAPPPSVIAMSIDVESGHVATNECPLESIRTEYFLRGTEPRDYCPLHWRQPGGGILGRIWRGVRGIF
ncbi:MAG TPA: PBP1A family penicillin-binding protein [Longimicrobiales bacterium]|nr:PBP1A family penicillin-binding protein [Longimicrobiales bacterium]